MEKNTLKIEVTPEQKEQIGPAASKKVTSARLMLEPLEERVTPKVSVRDFSFTM